MKKYFILFLCLITFILTLYSVKMPVFHEFSEVSTLYVGEANSNCKIVMTKNSFVPFILSVRGESVQIHNKNFNLNSLLAHFDARLIFIEELEEGTSYYAFSNQIKYRKIMKDKVVNLHVFIAENYVVLGSPIIFGSF